MSRNRFQRAAQPSCALTLCLLLTPVLMISPVLGQQTSTTDVELHVQRLSEQLQALDLQAESCLDALASAPAADDVQSRPEACVQFMGAIDGEPVANYLDRCREIKQWRDGFVTDNAGGDTDDSSTDSEADRERNLQRLIDIEFYCADDSLRLRTQYVFDAFAAVRQTSGVQQWGQQGIARQQPTGMAIPQSRTGGAVSSMHERVRQETEQRWQQLQLELIRQQSRRPVDYGLIQLANRPGC